MLRFSLFVRWYVDWLTHVTLGWVRIEIIFIKNLFGQVRERRARQGVPNISSNNHVYSLVIDVFPLLGVGAVEHKLNLGIVKRTVKQRRENYRILTATSSFHFQSGASSSALREFLVTSHNTHTSSLRTPRIFIKRTHRILTSPFR